VSCIEGDAVGTVHYRHAGIGGNMAWSTVMDEQHKVPAGCYRFRFELKLGWKEG